MSTLVSLVEQNCDNLFSGEFIGMMILDLQMLIIISVLPIFSFLRTDGLPENR